MRSQKTEGSLYETKQGEAPRDVKRLEGLFGQITSIKSALDRIDNRVEIIEAIEEFLKILLEKHPELATQVKNPLIQTVRDTVDNAIDASQGQSQAEPEMGLGESDRFNEVFGGMDEE
jgi:phage-related minor tail protein